ncbi:MAG: hypothetical protein J7K84_04015 [Deltaproteobacteria bacterium]|nr:hypothetical protein [Deltaproteobacteria bacterium]
MRDSYRKIKKKVSQLLCQDDFTEAVKEISALPAKKVINPLISSLCSIDKKIENRAAVAIGIVTAKLANNDIESARVIMRRLMWSLNDESGGIGWGAPVAMAEIMARNKMLADEYRKILISYSEPGKNYLEHEGLQKSVRCGLKRIVGANPCGRPD